MYNKIMSTKKQLDQLKKLNKIMKGRNHSRFKELDESIENRIVQLADRGLSAHTISIQLKAEGIVLNRGKIQRLIDAENIKRKNANQPILKVNKSIKAPFISNTQITLQDIQNRPQ